MQTDRISTNRAPDVPLRFGLFELDLRSHELRKRGERIRLAEKPFQVLELLLQRPGEVVTRQELQQHLWPADTFVDFDLSLNSAVRKLRDALGDSAEQPTFIETLPKLGYRFIGQVAASPANGANVPAPVLVPVPTRRRLVWAATTGLAVLTAVTWLQLSEGTSTGQQLTSRPASEVDPEAYALFLKGLDAAGRISYQGSLTAASYFEQAVVKQPDFAKAYERLAYARMQLIYTGPMSPRDVLPMIEDAAHKAIALDDTLVEPHRVLARTRRIAGDDAAADAEVRRALDLSPDGESLGLQAASLMRAGRFQEAIVAAERAVSQDPQSVDRQALLARMYRRAGRGARAIVILQSALQTEPGRPNIMFQLGATYMLEGDTTSAIAMFEEAVKRSTPSNPRFQAYLGYAYAVDGRVQEARQILNGLVALRETQYVSSFGIALIHDALGEAEAAQAALDRASTEYAVEFGQLDFYPPFRTAIVHTR